jgi:hydroxymethylglutaryl-CoA reductase (NADPH)
MLPRVLTVLCGGAWRVDLAAPQPADFVRERQQRVRGLPHWDSANDIVFDAPLEPYAHLVESLTAHAVLPVSIVGPLRVDLAQYDQAGATQAETTRTTEELYVPLAHTERALAASVQRGMTAITAAGTAIRTHVLKDRMTRDSCFLFAETRHAVAFATWVTTRLEAMQQWLTTTATDVSRHAILRKSTHVLGPACHVLYRFTTAKRAVRT